MERKLKLKSFSDVLEEAIKQRWGPKRKVLLVNASSNAKKSRIQPLKFAASQEDNQGTCITEHESCLSQPIVSENKVPYYTKQAARDWKPPLKAFQVFANKNLSVEDSNLSEYNSDPKGLTSYDNCQEKCSSMSSANCEARNSFTEVSDATQIHEAEKLPASNGGTTSQLEGVAVISNRQQCSDSDSVNKQTEMQNSTSKVQVSNVKENHLITNVAGSVSMNNSLTMTENTAKLEEKFVINRKTDLKADEMFDLSQQSTQPYVCSDSVTEAENLALTQEEATQLASKSPSYSTNDRHNIEINALHINNDMVKEDINKSSVLCVPGENAQNGKQEELSAGEETPLARSSECKELFKEVPSSDETFPPIISKSEMALNQQHDPSDTVCAFNSRESFTEINNQCCTDDLRGSDTNSLQKDEKPFCHEIKPDYPSSCKQIDALSEWALDIYTECKTYGFDNKRFTASLEAKFKNVFNFKDYIEDAHSKDEAAMFDKHEESTNNTSAAPNQDMHLKKPENYQVCIATVKISDDLKACQKSEEEMNGNYPEDAAISTAACDGFPALKSRNKEIISHSTTALPVEAETAQSSQAILQYDTDKDLLLREDNDIVMPTTERTEAENNDIFKYQKPLDVINTSSYQNIVTHVAEHKSVIYKERNVSFDKSELVLERKTLETKDKKPVIENENSEEKEFKCQRNTECKNVTVQSVIINTETSLDKVVNLKSMKENVTHCDIPDIKNSLNRLKVDHSSNKMLKDFMYPACFNRNTKEKTSASIDVTDHNIKYPLNELKANDHSSYELLDGRPEDAIYPACFDRNAKKEVSANSSLIDHPKNPLQQMKTSDHTANEMRENTINPVCFSNGAKNGRQTSIGLRDQNFKKPLEEMKTSDCTSNGKREKRPVDSMYPVYLNNGAKSETSRSTDLKVCNVKKSFVGIEASNHTSNGILKDRPEDMSCFNNKANNEKLPSAGLTDCCSETKNDFEKLINCKMEQFLQHETQKGAEDLVWTHKQSEYKDSGSRFLDTAASGQGAARNNHTDFSEMEDDFGITASQMLRIEDECQQKLLKPVHWAQRVKESRRKVHAAIQEISTLNAMLKKVRKQVWLPKMNTNGGSAQQFNTSHSWNRSFPSTSDNNMPRE